MRSSLRSAKALLGKVGPGGAGCLGPALLRAYDGMHGAGPEVARRPPSPRLVSWSC